MYGSLGAEGYFTETTPLCPHSPYSASKTSADMVVMAYHDTYKMPVTITRCSNNYGPVSYTHLDVYKRQGRDLTLQGGVIHVTIVLQSSFFYLVIIFLLS